MTDSFLQAENLHKTYPKGTESVRVLSGASFSVRQGEMLSIIGKSGAGKSTLLHVVGSLEAPDQGSIIYKGQDLCKLSATALADFRNNELGFVFQFHHLLPEFTAIENVMMPVLIQRQSRLEAARKASLVLEEVGLAHRLEHRPGELSGGEQQRVALARALVLNPSLLLADEVTGNLDEKTGEEIHDLLFRLNQERNITLIVVTHNLSLADRLPRRLTLENGIVMERP